MPMHPPDPFAALRPPEAEQMLTAWQHLRVPGAPAAFALRGAETRGPPAQRFRRRTLLAWECVPPQPSPGSPVTDRLALIDKATPHALHDLMLSEVSPTPKSTPVDVLPVTGRALWRSALEFVRFVSLPQVQADFHLSGGRLALAVNCDPYTQDRESVQAAKQFHLHLLYWSAAELQAIATPQPLSATVDARMRRQLLDPLSFLSGPLIATALADLDLSAIGGRLLDADLRPGIQGQRPPGCLIELPGWSVLGEAAFESLVRTLHQRLAALAGVLTEALLGHSEPPAPWCRHALRRASERRAAVRNLGLPETLESSLMTLGNALRDLSPASAARLRAASPAARQHCMSLNQPCYGLNLYAPQVNTPEQPVAASSRVYLLLSAKLFSGIGCAGLLPIGTVPSVRILRGAGEFSAARWQERAAWQRAFATRLRTVLAEQSTGTLSPVRRLRDFTRGWC